MGSKNTADAIIPLIVAGVIVLGVLTLTGFGHIRAAQDNASYTSGDYYIDFKPEVSEVGVSSQGFITCGEESGNFARCGEGKYPGYNEVLELTPILVIISVFVVLGVSSFQILKSGKQNFGVAIMVVFSQLVISAVLSAIIIALLNVFDGQVAEVAKSSVDTGIIGVLKLGPTLLALIAIVLPALLALPIGLSTESNKVWRGY